ncbi:MAG: Cys-Gln thioester bond-forming surface protein [Actinomycetaceae bacterium]|nr:Cys-Gln thioester bond-forming surface protein [Actinomycetaceae bacterium]
MNGYKQRSFFYTVTTNVTTGQGVNEVVYCVNANKNSPAFNSRYIKKDGSGDTLAEAASTSRLHNPDELRSKLMSIMYNGYPSNASQLQGNLNDQQFRSVTQLAVWDTVDGGNRSYVLTNQEMKNAYNALMQYKQNVPENLEAHMYQIVNDQRGTYQSLMGTAFAEIAAPMEVSVTHAKITKADVTFSKTEVDGTDELPGAALEIRDANGKTIESWISEKTPHVFSLTPGIYSMHESQAPLGYDVAEDITFRITDAFQVEIKEGDKWTPAANATVKMEDKLKPVTYDADLPTPTPGEEKPNLPNTGIKDVLAKTGGEFALPIVLTLVLLAGGVIFLRKKRFS